jgi:hypothetical protein
MKSLTENSVAALTWDITLILKHEPMAILPATESAPPTLCLPRIDNEEPKLQLFTMEVLPAQRAKVLTDSELPIPLIPPNVEIVWCVFVAERIDK